MPNPYPPRASHLRSRAAAIGLIASLGLGMAFASAAAAPRGATAPPAPAKVSAPTPAKVSAPTTAKVATQPAAKSPAAWTSRLRPRGTGIRTPVRVTPTSSARRAPGGIASFPQIVGSYPPDGATRILPDATIAIAFDQPTAKSGAFSVADLDSGNGGVLLNLDSPTWSALGDTVFLKPSQPMEYGHQHGFLVNLILATDSTASNDLFPVRYFRIFARAKLERMPSTGVLPSVTLVPGTPVPVTANVRELNDNSVTFTSAQIEYWASTTATFNGGTPPTPLLTTTIPVAQVVPRAGTARLSVPVTLPKELAGTLASGLLGLRVRFSGTDEIGLPIVFDALSTLVSAVPPDTLLTLTPSLVMPAIASSVVIQSAILEQPLPGAVYAAGDTVRARATVTGIGTGPFRAIFYLDGNAVAMEEGFMEAGRPVTVEPRGPIMSRRFGEHKFQFVVESPQGVASQPITILCVPPANGVMAPASQVVGEDSVVVPPPPSRLKLDGTYLLVGKSEFRDEEQAGIAWSAWRARYDVTKTGSLEANVLWRLRVDDPQNGSASPEQVKLKYGMSNASVEWGDMAPSLATNAPLFASAVPRRSAQVAWAGTPVGKLEGYAALDSRPRSSAGPLEAIRSDLYAARLTRAFAAEKVTASLYGGYTHDDPAADSSLVATRASAIYGGAGRWNVRGDWTLAGDVATVRHRAIEGVDPGRSRTAVKGEVKGTVAGFAARAEGFRYQPDCVTTLNPYALSDRRGLAAELSRDVIKWNFFANYRTEKPEETVGLAPEVSVTRWIFGGKLTLNQVSFVVPSFIRVQHRGVNTEFNESRIAGELVIGEKYDGQTRARIDLARFEDELGVGAKRFVGSGSVVSTRKHSEGVTSTASFALVNDESEDTNLTDQTIQAALEIRWEAIAGKFLVTPLITYFDRDYDTLDQGQQQLTGRLQLTLLRVPHLGENALSVEGRVDRIESSGAFEDKSTEGSVQITFGQQFSLSPRR